MSETDAAAAAVAHVAAAARAAANALIASGVRDEPLAEYIPRQRRLLVFARDSRMREIGRVWRLGVLLLDRDGNLFATGETARAVDPGWPQYQAASAEVRREYRGAAQRGGFEPGQTVNFNAQPITLDAELLRESSGPLFVRDGEAFVRWSRSVSDAAAMPFDAYLSERVELLRHPPEGA